MTSGGPNIAMRRKMVEILLKVPIESYRMFFTAYFRPYWVLSYKGAVTYAPPPHYGEVD